MNASLIEKMDKSRYKLITWFCVGWTLWFGGFILKDFIQNKLILVALTLIGLIGWVIFAINLIRLNRLGKIINADIDLKNALSDELAIHNRNKSLIVGYWTVIILVSIFFAISLYISISALLVCELTLFFGILSSLIANLLYNRD